MSRVIGGWTRDLARWQQQRQPGGFFAAEMAGLQSAAEAIFGALDYLQGADRHQAMSGLQPPGHALRAYVSTFLLHNQMLWMLDVDEAAEMLAAWRGENARAAA